MTELQNQEANSILQAIALRIQNTLPPPQTPANPDAARQRIGVLSNFAALADHLVKSHPDLAPSRESVDRTLEAGRTVSAVVPYRCVQCLDLYYHQPPESTTTLCQRCVREQKLSDQPQL